MESFSGFLIILNAFLFTECTAGFRRLSVEERVAKLSAACELTSEEVDLLLTSINNFPNASKMIENVVGSFALPLGIATNFVVNGKSVLIPMVTEEPSVIAAASNGARMALPHGGFTAETIENMMIGQVQIVDLPLERDIKQIVITIEKDRQEELLLLMNKCDPKLVELGGGARRIEVFVLPETSLGVMLDIHILVDVLDAMGANAVNTMAEAVSFPLSEITGGKPLLRIISNLANNRITRCSATFDKKLLGGDEVVERILSAVEFARHSIHRAATHNKGIMNGVSAAVLASGNDTRAAEAGAHTWAAFKKPYAPLTRYWKDDQGNLCGEIELPLAIGIIGGAISSHPVAQLVQKILKVKSASEMAQIFCALGLSQNLAALRALSAEGIQKGHMRLHAGNVVRNAHVPPSHHEDVLTVLLEESVRSSVSIIRVDTATRIYHELLEKEKKI